MKLMWISNIEYERRLFVDREIDDLHSKQYWEGVEMNNCLWREVFDDYYNMIVINWDQMFDMIDNKSEIGLSDKSWVALWGLWLRNFILL